MKTGPHRGNQVTDLTIGQIVIMIVSVRPVMKTGVSRRVPMTIMMMMMVIMSQRLMRRNSSGGRVGRRPEQTQEENDKTLGKQHGRGSSVRARGSSRPTEFTGAG